MKLEEAITKCLIGEEHLDQAEYEQVGKWLEELKSLRYKYSEKSKNYERLDAGYVKLEKELEVFRKALKLACTDIYYEGCNGCRLVGDYCDACNRPNDYADEYLMKAWKENDT